MTLSKQYISPEDNILVIDIGGGSTEFIIGNRKGISFAKSENVGALRMTEKFLTTDIVDDYEFDMMSEFIEEEIKNTIDYLKEREINKGREKQKFSLFFPYLNFMRYKFPSIFS